MIGHAIEATSKFEVLHGEVVSIGMALEARLGEAVGVTAKGTAERIVRLLELLRLPVERPDGASADQLIEVMRGNKKVRGGRFGFALPKEIGAVHGDGKHGWTLGLEEQRTAKVLDAVA
jgi:3-dehydroquinate synthase